MTFPIRPATTPALHPIVGPDEVGPRNEDEQRLLALLNEAIDGPPATEVDLDAFFLELRAHLHKRSNPGTSPR